MANRLSHSALNRFQQCPKSYDFHYNKRLREKTTSGALLFGSALDSALNTLLTKPKESPEAAFDEAFTTAKVGQHVVSVQQCTDVVYSATDFDRDLLTKGDYEYALAMTGELSGDPLELFKSIGENKKALGWENLPLSQKSFYNMMNWLSLRRKGYLMLKAYREEIQPHIRKVLAVQKKIEIANNEGDSIIGFVDAVLVWDDGRIVIADHKTSSIEYGEKAVLTSPQLTLYVSALGEEYKTRYAGFIVLRKGIIKNKKKVCKLCFYEAEKGSRHKTCSQVYSGARCTGEWIETIDPKVDIQILIDQIPEQSEKIVMENFDETNHLIKQGVFTRNFNSCLMPWGKCSYFDLCWKGDMSGLEQIPIDDKIPKPSR